MRMSIVLLAFLLMVGGPASAAKPELRIAEYACFGSGGRILIGLGFKVRPGGRYTDLDGGSPGTFTISDDAVIRFVGGHLGGMIGRVAQDGSTTVGPTSCSPGS